MVLSLLLLYYALLMLNLLLEGMGRSELPLPPGLPGPLVWLYIKGSRGELKAKDGLLSLPGATAFLLPLPDFPFDLVWNGLFAFLSLRSARQWRGRAEGKESPGAWFLLLPSLILLSTVSALCDFIFMWIGIPPVSDLFSLLISLLEAGLIFIPAWIVMSRSQGILIPLRETVGAYGKNRLAEDLMEEYGRRLREAMQGRSLYRDPDLTLGALAKRLEIPPVSLSQLINRETGGNFHRYINGLRIQEACRLLLDDPGKTVLEILYEVGFNSKSTFNSAFKAGTGMTPREYRARNRG